MVDLSLGLMKTAADEPDTEIPCGRRRRGQMRGGHSHAF
jgi:hypothetical protein